MNQNNSGNKGQNTRIKKREAPAPREAHDLNDHLNNIRKCPIPWMCESRVVRSDLVSVCVKRKMLMHNNNISNEKKITEMKDNKIINAKNKI